MAAPTNVRVEATSISTTKIRWSYSGSNQIAVYRSTNGSAYSEVTGPGTRVPAGTTSYEDTGLSTGTKYWYKLSDDVGSTFSSVVTVWTHGCPAPAVGGDGFSLPRFDGEEQQSDQLNNMAQRIEAALQGRVLDPQDCPVCPDDGRVVFDCSGGCRDFVVVADEDVNSISIQMCDEGSGTFNFIIPPNQTRKICGWPAGFGFTGDECTDAPISGGSIGRTMSVGYGGGRANPAATKSRPGYSGGVGRGGGGGGGGCTCVPGPEGQLTIKSCNANNSLNCSSGKSGKFIACGGKGPYTWSKTGTVQISGTSGASVTVTPPANSGSGVSGTAYWLDCWACGDCFTTPGTCTQNPSFPPSVVVQGDFNCNDEFISALPGDPSPCDRITACTPAPSASTLSKCCNANIEVCDNASGCVDPRGYCPSGIKTVCDKRSAQMISDGCNPCALAASGATLTVTDALGQQATIMLGA